MKRTMKPIHPGAILREDVLKPYHLTITDAARDLQISRKQLSEIVNEKSPVTTEMVIRLEQVFKIAANFWLDLQRDFDLWKIKESGRIHLKPLTGVRA
jgi:addiction module HigA family antidote